MKLHSKNIVKTAGERGDGGEGASNEQIEEVSQQMIKEGNISVSRAKEIMESMNKTNKQHDNYHI
jgi:hydroxymethylglutaryl-CoA reductase